MKLNIKDTFNKELPSDPIHENSRRQVEKACFSYVMPKKNIQARTGSRITRNDVRLRNFRRRGQE